MTGSNQRRPSILRDRLASRLQATSSKCLAGVRDIVVLKVQIFSKLCIWSKFEFGIQFFLKTGEFTTEVQNTLLSTTVKPREIGENRESWDEIRVIFSRTRMA
jgi:hypothetical protein